MNLVGLRARGAVAGALTAAAGWLVEPAEPGQGLAGDHRAPGERPVVAVVGLAPGCGATAVARALGAELAARDDDGACAVTATSAGSVPLGLPSAARLARSLGALPGVRTRACGRLCLAECGDPAALAGAVLYRAPLVLDVADPREAPVASALSDSVILVATPRIEPSLASVLTESLRRVGPEPITVLNRALGDDGPWTGRAGVELPESRMGAQLALAGREPRGDLGRALADLADRVEDGR